MDEDEFAAAHGRVGLTLRVKRLGTSAFGRLCLEGYDPRT
jgi:hypothetical protein